MVFATDVFEEARKALEDHLGREGEAGGDGVEYVNGVEEEEVRN